MTWYTIQSSWKLVKIQSKVSDDQIEEPGNQVISIPVLIDYEYCVDFDFDFELIVLIS